MTCLPSYLLCFLQGIFPTSFIHLKEVTVEKRRYLWGLGRDSVGKVPALWGPGRDSVGKVSAL